MYDPTRLKIFGLRGRNGKYAVNVGLRSTLIAARHLQTDTATEREAVVWIDGDGRIEVPEGRGIVAHLAVAVATLRQRIGVFRLGCQYCSAGFDDARWRLRGLTAAVLERCNGSFGDARRLSRSRLRIAIESRAPTRHG
jgi:hypothetical protein